MIPMAEQKTTTAGQTGLVTTNQDHHGGAENHQGRSGGTGDHHSVADETGELETATLAETKQAGKSVMASVAITGQAGITRKITMVITGQAGSSVSASVAIVEPSGDTESSEAVSPYVAVSGESGKVCAAQTHKMIVAVTESTVDNGSTSGSDSAEIGRLEGDEARWA